MSDLPADSGERRRRQQERFYRYALYFSVCFHAVHFISLPLNITPDGFGYVHLSEILFTERFPRDWYFLRGPLYSLLLKISFNLLGKNALAAILPGVLLGFAGIWALAAAARRAVSPLAGAVVCALLTLFPTLIAYEHTVLTEAGSFCFLALLTNVLLWQAPAERRWAKSALLIAILGGAYYHRAPLIYLAPVAGCLAGITCLPPGTLKELLAQWRTALPHTAAVTLLPFALASPWSAAYSEHIAKDAGRASFIPYLLHQDVLPVDHPLFDEQGRRAYQEARNRAVRPLGLSGVPFTQEEISALAHICERGELGPALLAECMLQQPGRYLAAVGRTILLYAGVPPARNSENDIYVLEATSVRIPQSKYLGPPVHGIEFSEHFLQENPRATPTHYLVRALHYVYYPLIPIGWIFTLLALWKGFARREASLLTLGAVPAAFAAMHVICVFALNRYAMPAFPLVLANIVMVPWLLRGRALTSPPPSETRSSSCR